MSHQKIDGSVGISELDTEYWNAIRRIAVERHFDGCSGVDQTWRDVCFSHDLHYATHKDLWGNPLTRWQADMQFLKDMQIRAKAGYWSLWAWKRWLGVRLFGGKPWSRGGK